MSKRFPDVPRSKMVPCHPTREQLAHGIAKWFDDTPNDKDATDLDFLRRMTAAYIAMYNAAPKECEP